jgi:hypothetical protein
MHLNNPSEKRSFESNRNQIMPMIVLNQRETTPVDFVSFWQPRYAYPNDSVYTVNIRLGTPDSLKALFRWKIGERLWKTSQKLINENFISRSPEWESLAFDTTAEQFLDKFSNGGPIWRIFWLHCWNQRFPIYDQHVHRAMMFIKTGRSEELSGTEAEKISSYLNCYRPFFDEKFEGIKPRHADQALWTFGKFIKTWEKKTPAAFD